MRFMVVSRAEARRWSYNENIPDCVIISISDMFAQPNTFHSNSHIKDILRLNFDDIDEKNDMSISEEDAKKILEFTARWINRVDNIIVHCNAGISRSSGVCAALMNIFTGDDSEIFDNPRYVPNRLCYRTVLFSPCIFNLMGEKDLRVK